MVYHKRTALALATLGLVAAAPIQRREVPQEHSHEKQLRVVNTFLQQSNPDGIVDAVFGLLGNAAASQGIGNFAGGPDCLQTGIADRAFTNAKAAGDVEGMTSALIYRAVERNTGGVGVKSVLCTQFTPVNPEIAALTQHQDPASDGAAAANKAITLELARQIASIGGNAQDALLSGTFAPGQLGDATARGNTCDVADDAAGCIFSQNLIVFDATADEINAAVSGVSAGTGDSSTTTTVDNTETTTTTASSGTATGTGSNNPNVGSCAVDGGAAAPPPADTTTTATADATTTTDAAATTSAAAPPATGSLDFGSCTDPTVIFGAGLDGRKATEFSFLPNNLQEFNHNSALNPDIIYQFQCDTLVNKCGFTRDDAIVATCQSARIAAVAVGRIGASADLFNSLLGFTTDFAALDTAAPAAATSTAAAPAATSTAAAPVVATPAAAGSLNFGSCTDPSVIFGAGLDGRKATEFSFLPNNLQEFSHGSALNPDIIYQFQCDTLVNKCGFKREDAIVATCQSARTQAVAVGRTGASADLFNSLLGFTTNFAALDTAAPAAATSTAAAATSTAAASAPANTAVATGALDFGSCSNPSIQFGAGLDGRGANEFSFQAVNLQDFNHGSALNSGVITDFICLQFINKCGLKDGAPAITACRAGKAAADALGKVGAAADAFNKAFGISTNFAAVKAN